MAKIKICGLFHAQDIDYVNESRPDFVGFVFAESRRKVSADEAALLRAGLDSAIIPVGVFVDAPIEEITALYVRGVIRVAQLHGNESEDYIRRLRQQSSIRIIKTIKVGNAQDILDRQDSSADWLLLDSGDGGTGRSFDWGLIPSCRRQFFLAGGIHLGNIDEALSYAPYCVDVSSGAEANGRKDRDKIVSLVQKVRGGE